MSAIVDYSYYSGAYLGTEADEASFPALAERATDIVSLLTRGAVTAEAVDRFPAPVAEACRRAVCAQVDALVSGGGDLSPGRGGGFTVGRVTVWDSPVGAGGLRGAVSPLALALLEQTGLLGRSCRVDG